MSATQRSPYSSGYGATGMTTGRANADGSGAVKDFITGAKDPTGIAVDRRSVYWANQGTNSNGRANLAPKLYKLAPQPISQK